MKTRENTRTHGSARRSERLEPVLLVVSDGPSKGVRLSLSSGSVVIGSSPECDLVIADPTISRRHAIAGLVPDGVQLKDLGSRNGTRYLGARIDSAVIPTGASVKLGKTTLRVSQPSQPEPDPELDQRLGLLGQSRVMKRLFASLPKVARAEATVLLRGETGTGKSELARALHRLSPRADGPFVTVDCGVIPPTLFASTLFGHARGAFTGANRDHPGLVATAAGGTLFLDEVAEVPLELQPSLLRLLETSQYVPVGTTAPRDAQVRFVAATTKDLEAEAAAGRFRKDLYFRLAGIELLVPPLRERREDLAPLARHFARELKGVELQLGAATIAAFQCEAWPGNVRELKNAVARALTLGPTEREELTPRTFTEARDQALLHFERDYLEALVNEHGGNVSAAARAAKLTRSYFYTLLERHQLVARPAKR